MCFLYICVFICIFIFVKRMHVENIYVYRICIYSLFSCISVFNSIENIYILYLDVEKSIPLFS